MNKRLIDFMMEAIRYSVESPTTVGEFEIVTIGNEPFPWNDFKVVISSGFERQQWMLSLVYTADGASAEHYQMFTGIDFNVWPKVMQFLVEGFSFMDNDIDILFKPYFEWSEDTLNRMNAVCDEMNSLKRFGLE